MKLNIGGGSSHIEGYLNVDLHAPDADLRFDISQLWPIEDSSVDAIYSHHAFEHVSYRDEDILWLEVYRVLKPEGTLHVEVPDFKRILALFLVEDEVFDFAMQEALGISPWGEPMRFIFGYQKGEGQVHLSAYTSTKFAAIGHILGFSSFSVTSILTGNMPCLKFLAVK